MMCKISVSLPFLKWIQNEIIFYRISELMLETSIHHRDYLKFYRLSGATFYDYINTICQFIKPFLDKKKCLFLRNMEPLNIVVNDRADFDVVRKSNRGIWYMPLKRLSVG